MSNYATSGDEVDRWLNVEAATGLLSADELARTRVGDAAASAGVPPPAARQAVAADQAPLTLLQLPAEILVFLFGRLDARSLARLAATSSELFREQMTPVEEALRQRAAARGRVCPDHRPQGFSSLAVHLAWLEHRRDEAWFPVAAGFRCSFVVDARGGRLMSCGAERMDGQEVLPGVFLGHGELDGEATPLPTMTGIRISSVSACYGYNAAVSAAGVVYTWGKGLNGRLGHGDNERSLVPKQVQALAGQRVLSVAAGEYHCLAVTEKGEVFSWGRDLHGRCGHGSSKSMLLVPRRLEALTGIRARSASASGGHSLVVTEEGALYSFGHGANAQLGHSSSNDELVPKKVNALRRVRIASAAAGGFHSLALAEDGTVFSWGVNENGQLGLGRSEGYERSPQRVAALIGIDVRSVAAGNTTSFAVTASGKLFTWGHGQYGRLGHGNTADQLAPRCIAALQDEWVVAVSPGFAHTIAVTRGGSVFGWGRAGDVEFGLPNNYWIPPRLIPQLLCGPRP